MTSSQLFHLVVAVSLSLALPSYSQEEAAPADPPVDPPAADKADPTLEQYYVANGAYNRKLYPVAVQQYQAFLEAHPDHAKADLARRGLALSHYASKQYKEAIEPLSSLLGKEKLDPSISRERLVMMHGQCLLITGEKDKAKTLYAAEIATLKTPAYLHAALASIADVSFGSGQWGEVVTWTDKLLGAQPDKARAARGYYQQGYAHYQLKDPEKAIEALSKIETLEADPVWITRGLYLTGECYNQLKKSQEAMQAFQKALPGLKGQDAIECRYRLGLTRFVLKQHEESAADLTAYLEASPDGAHAPEAKLYLARTHLERGSFETAGTQLKALAEGASKVAPRANLWYARVYTRPETKDYTGAASILATATETYAESPIINDLRFDYANALMAKPEPDWENALAALSLLSAAQNFGQQAEVLNQTAVCQQKLRKYEESLASNNKFLGEHAEHQLAGEARFMKAENLFLLDRLEEASKGYADFLSAHADHPNKMPASFRQAQIHHAAGRWTECLETATAIAASKPEGPLYAQLPFMIGDSLFRQKKWKEAIAPLSEFLASRVTKTDEGRNVKAGPNVDTALIQLAVCHDRGGNREAALDHLETVANHYPGQSSQLPLALAEQGRLAYEDGNLKLARTAFEKFRDMDKAENESFAKSAARQRPRVNYYLGWVEAIAGKHGTAAANFAAVVQAQADHPLAPDAALQHGIALFNAGSFDKSTTQFQAVLQQYEEHPKLARVVYHLGLSLSRKNAFAEAAKQFQRINEEFSKSDFADHALYEWAWCERGTKRQKEAIDLYNLLLKNHPESSLAPKVQSELAELNVDSGAQDQVIADLSATLEKVQKEPLREELRYQLASAHFKKADHATAAGQFEKLLEDYPQSRFLAPMHFQAGESQLQLKQIEKAQDHFTAAAKIQGSPQSLVESITMRLAETQALTGQHSEAASSYQGFLEKFPESRWTRNALFGFAFATENAGDPTSALAEYGKILDEPKTDLWTVRSRFQTGSCQTKLEKHDQAIVEFVKVEISYPQYPNWQAEAVLQIGRILLVQGKPEQARDRLKEVISRFEKEEAAATASKLLTSLKENNSN
ncbi:MAG: tetratricopeptide repeat protein [Roseibacillus sp.]|nr:tetratricopeptide repeat protein [Roseibacillus sp.]